MTFARARIAQSLIALSLIASSAIAQSDGRLLVNSDYWIAKTYGEALAGSAMSLDIGIEPAVDIEPVELAWREAVLVTLSGGGAGDVLAYMIGFDQVRVSLASLAEGTLLVAPAAIVVVGSFDIGGQASILVDFNNAALNGLDIYVQGASLSVGDGGVQLALSQGLHVAVAGVPRES